MNFRFSEELERFQQEVRDFCVSELPSDWLVGELFADESLETEEDWALYRSIKRKLGEKGWLSIAWPREYGGQGSRMKSVILEEQIHYYGLPGYDNSLTCGIVAPTLLLYCTEEQKRKHLPPIARGETAWCEGFSEPDAGSDLASLTTRAIEKGDYFIVDGQKTWTSLGLIADWGIFLFRTDPHVPKHRGISMFLVELTSPGITRNPLKNRVGRACWCETFFDGVQIPKENLVGKKNQGWQVAMSTLNNERSGMQWLAASRRCLDRTIKYVKETGSLAKNPTIRHKLASLAIDAEVARLLCYHVEWLREQGATPIHEASMAKEYTADLSVRVAEVSLHILGLYGQLRRGSKYVPLKGSIPESFLDYASWWVSAGSPEILRNIIATRGLGLPR